MDDFSKNYQSSRGALQDYINQLESSVKNNQPTGFFSNVDPVMLGLAQGFLSPTKTGGFGESIGLGLAGAQAPLEAMRKRQLDAQEKILQTRLATAKLDMEAPYWSRRGITGLGGEGTPNAQINALKGELASLQYATPEVIAALEARGIDINEAMADIISQMSQIRTNMRSAGGKKSGIGSDTGANSGGIPRITDDAAGEEKYNQLSPGSDYIDPSGKLRRKPAVGERG